MFIPKRGARIIAPNITITIAVMGMEAESRGLRCCLWRVPVGLLVVILKALVVVFQLLGPRKRKSEFDDQGCRQ